MADKISTSASTTQTPSTTTTTKATAQDNLPRITITYCTQCRWLLRAAWLQQELLSTFATSLGEVSLLPSTGGTFQIHLLYLPPVEHQEHTNEGAREVCLWDRKADGGFPEAKVLKQRVRDCVDPGSGLGHSDRGGKKEGAGGGEGAGKGEGEEEQGKGGQPPDLAAAVRENGPRNPLTRRTGAGDGGGEGGVGCEDCA